MDLTAFRSQLQSVVNQIKEDLKSIRTGKANPALLENLIVETYGGQTKLRMKEVATITNEGPAFLAILPYDPSTLKDIEKAVLTSPLSLTPAVQGNRITIKIPALSTEQRERLIKHMHQTLEEKKGVVRNLRDDMRKRIKSNHEKKEITDDQKYKTEKDIDTITQEIMEEIQEIRENKEQEIREV